jgi:hypothetical protein
MHEELQLLFQPTLKWYKFNTPFLMLWAYCMAYTIMLINKVYCIKHLFLLMFIV